MVQSFLGGDCFCGRNFMEKISRKCEENCRKFQKDRFFPNLDLWKNQEVNHDQFANQSHLNLLFPKAVPFSN